MFAQYQYDSTGKIKTNKDGVPLTHRRRVVLDCSNDEPITEQAHAHEVNVNNIVKRHGVDLIAKTSKLMSQDFQFDDVTGNDFHEAMNIILKAQGTFSELPSNIRKEFDNNPAMFLDFVQNPDNIDRMVDLGLAQRHPEPQPVEVVVTNPEPNPEAPTV